MGANAFQYDVKLNLSADTKLARTQIESLQSQLKSISNLNLNFNGIDQLTSKVNEASDAALKLQTHLAAALNPDTGNLDFSKFNNSILRSGDSIENLSYSLLKAGSSGTKAFVSLADSISRSEIPLLRTSKLVNGLYDNLKKTAGWQISSSIIHGVMGQYQQAIGYAKALDKSLTDIRIVTGQSADQMARFAKEANAAAKKLSTTTVDYTDASLIYYQQGLSDAEVKKRSDITIKMANATGVSAAKVSDQLTSIWNNFDNGTKSLEYYADVMTALGAATASSTDEIAKGVQKFAAISDTVGLSYEYATSALATITATTRESADTVGNSLKTLFSRIQGLQLGDTLDDGTTLNKYSTALAKVGISIKNANGELKSMDTLLNEMGSKWNTLAEDQQMALAQTVGGARQYTQIMTLMENWDFFKENLTTAKTATGTLTQQAEIYADSWEAAQKRFKASQESLYDTLINSNSFKKILNIGSTIVEGISNALSGTNGLPGLLGTIGPILGMTFKKQLGESLSSTLYNIGSLIPGVRKGIENARQVQLTNMLHSIRDAEVTPDLGKHERNATASIIERQYTEREQKEKYRAKMSGASEALDVEYEKLLKNIDQQQLDLSRQQDEAELNAEYAADALRNEKYNKRNISSELTDSFGRVLVTDSQLGKDNDIAHALKLVGAREGQAEISVDQLVQKLTADKSNAYDLKTLKGDMADIYGSLIGASDHEIAKLKSGTGITTDREKALKSQFDKLMDDYRAAEEEMFNQYGDNPRAFASELPDILRMTMEDYETRVLTSLGFMEEGVAVGEQTNAKDIMSNSSRAAILKREQEKRGQARQEVVGKREELWAQSGPSMAESAVGIASGIGATYGAIQSAYGTFNSIKDGNWGGALTGLIATGYNMTSGMGDLTQSFQDLGRHGKALKNRPDIQKYNLLQQQQELQLKQSQVNELDKGIEQDKKRLDYLLQSKALNEQEQTDLNNLEKKAKEGKLQSKADKNRLEGLRDKQERYINNFLPEVKNLQLGITSQEAKKDEIGFNPETLKKVSKDLEKLDDVTAGKFSGAINKVGDGLEFVSKHADKFTIGLQAAQIAMTATAKINEYFYNEETRQAQKAATTANELANAHQTAQNNYNLLLNSIEEYNTKTNELADSNLKGAAKQAAIYDQNQAALNLIDKYNITDFKYIGDKIQISEDALEKAQEESIQAMSTAKYASGLANLSAKKEANDVIEEALERDLVYDESFQQGAGVLLAGASGAAIGATIGSVVPVIGTAIGGIVGGIAGTLVGAVNAAWADDIGERERENSFVDKAIEKTRETGSTSWMDDYAGDEFSADELKKLKENRSAIKQQAASEAAYEQAELAHRESIANDILANNDRTEKFKYADRILDGLASQVQDWEELGNTYGEWYESEKTRINAAKNIQSELGLSGNVVWEDNKKNKMLTYTTEDGQTGTLSYETLSKMEGVKKGKAQSDAYIEQMMEAYDVIKEDADEQTAAGVLSFLSSGNFDNATFGETDKAQQYLADAVKNYGEGNYDAVAASLGLDFTSGQGLAALEAYAKEQGYTTTTYDDYGNAVIEGDFQKYIDNVLQGSASYASGARTNLDALLDGKLSQFGGQDFKNSDIYGSMSNATAQDFYSQLNYISSTQGEEAAQTYLNSLTGILKDANPEDYGEIMSSLMALDASDWSIDTSIIDIMEEYGVTIDNTNGSLQQFVNMIRTANGSIQGLEDKMTSLIQVAGSLKGLEIGKSVSDDILQNLKDQGINLDDETFSTWDGENVLIQDIDSTKEVIRDKTSDAYHAYDNVVDSVEGSILLRGLSEDEKAQKLSELGQITQEDFEDMLQYGDENYDENMGVFVRQVLSDDERMALNTNINKKEELESDLEGYKWDADAKQYVRDDGSVMDAATYNQKTSELQGVNEGIAATYNNIKDAITATKDPAEIKELSEQYVSLFDSYEEAMADSVTQDMIAEGYLEAGDALAYYASKYPDLIDDIEAYNHAMEYGTDKQKENAESQLQSAVAIRDAMTEYQKITGQKITLKEFEAAIQKVKEQLGESLKDGLDVDLSDAQLAKVAEEAMITSNAYHNLKNNYSSWLSTYKAGGDTVNKIAASGEALTKLATNIKNFLGLSDLKTSDAILEGVIKDYIDKGGDIGKLLTDRSARVKLTRDIILASNLSLSNKLNERGSGPDGYTESAYELRKAIDALTEIATSSQYGDGIFGTGELSEADQGKVKKANDELLANTDNWEEYQAAVEASGGRTVNSFSIARENTSGEGGKYTVSNYTYVQKEGGGGAYIDQNGNEYDGTANLSFGEAGADGKFRTGGGGGGGGGPTKVQVKSAQEAMTRYKTTDDKMARAEMEKTAALQAKDLLYGEAKIRQLNRINGLLRKQQQLTADRIKEEMDYLKKDKAHLEEVLKRYNKDLKDDEKIELEFNNEGIITNYKQTIGKWAEELADFYRDGELTAEEGKKAEKLQKRIQDLQTVIQDYEDSLNQLLESITAYENSLYEMFSNQMEVLTYKVQYKLEMENDDLSYISFYADAIKDSMGQITDFVELTGEKAKELYDQIEVYNQGVTDIIDFAKENPLQLWAAEGIEGMYTAEQIETLRQYRDGLSSTYQKLAGLRKEVEEKVLKTFDYWNEKVEKGINSISRYTDMLSQFKDIVNITGREVLGLSDSFMATFEQQSIDQSMDNIKAAKTHYEALAKTYEDAQAKLAEAQAAGNEESIEHWQDVVNKTQEEMESAQDSMLTTLNHTLNMINEQFTNSLNEAIETFNEKLYEFNGLEGLIADYEQIREQQDLMVEDYEKIYNLSKLNRNLEKTLNDTKLIAGKQKLLEFQEKINEINKSNVELSRYELEYLQAEYELKLAEIELENARSAKDTVRLSKDNEGNWSYIYTQNEQAVDEAQQKYEDALFKMQQMSRDYTKEMNKAMMDITQQMNEEIAALAIQDFETPEAYEAEVRRIQEKYQAQLEFREQELNKSLQNNANLYEQDWANYSKSQGYKISEAEDWVDTFGETTLGTLLGSNAALSDYTSLIGNMSNLLAGDLASAAATYFTNADKALQTYGTSLKGFKNMLSTTTNSITTESKQATKEVTDMADKMVNAFTEIADKVRAWQVEFGDQISELLEELGKQIEAINQIIEKSDALGKQLPDTNEMIGQKEAAERIVSLNKEKGYMSDLSNTEDGMLKWGDKEYTIVEFNGKLVDDINTALSKYANAKTGTQAREDAKQELNRLIMMYKDFRRIIELIYDATDLGLTDPKIEETVGMDTGGYTGEWGNEGKLAFLHEKELVLNKNDTANFLEALIASKDLINSMIEMNAHQSSLALGNLIPNTIQDMSQTLEQQVSIVAEFPNAVNHSEIEEAFDNIINMASQYANRPRD